MRTIPSTSETAALADALDAARSCAELGHHGQDDAAVEELARAAVALDVLDDATPATLDALAQALAAFAAVDVLALTPVGEASLRALARADSRRLGRRPVAWQAPVVALGARVEPPLEAAQAA